MRIDLLQLFQELEDTKLRARYGLRVRDMEVSLNYYNSPGFFKLLE